MAIKSVRLIFLFLICMILEQSYNKFEASSSCHQAFAYLSQKGESSLPLLVPSSIEQIDALFETTIECIKKNLHELEQLTEYTFSSVCLKFDKIHDVSSYAEAVFALVSMVHPDEKLRSHAHEASVRFEKESIDLLHKKKWHDLLDAYHNKMNDLSEEDTVEREFLRRMLERGERMGLSLEEEKQQKISSLIKEEAELCSLFEKAIADATTPLLLLEEELEGVSDSFKAGLVREGEKYKIAPTYPCAQEIAAHCKVRETRKKMVHLMSRRAYPENKERLERIIQLRHERAQLLGYATYTEYEQEVTMAKNPETVYQFADTLTRRVEDKRKEELLLWQTTCSDSSIASLKQLAIWDIEYAQTLYKKEHLKLDAREVARYFPLEHTIAGLLEVYEQFFGLVFKRINVSTWHPEVWSIEVQDPIEKRTLGYVHFDLHPRPGKYTHACKLTFVHALKGKYGNRPGAAVIIANFSKGGEGKPSLLRFEEVTTFFHEFGHAMHALLGHAPLSLFSGTQTKRDFVEMPSQMFEEWLLDASILEKISAHHETGQPLPEHMRKKLIEASTFNSGYFISRQLGFTYYSLECFSSATGKVDLDALLQEVRMRTTPEIEADPESRLYASFGHLVGYGSCYYGYLWSRVFACDLFEQIKEKNGLLDPLVGRKCAKILFEPGGSIHPDTLLKRFLGREPLMEAFFRRYGI